MLPLSAVAPQLHRPNHAGCCCRGHITVALLSHCHSCTAVAFAQRRRCIVDLPPSDIAPTITAVAVALPSWLPLHCGCIAAASLLALLSRHLGRGAEALMLGVGWSPGPNLLAPWRTCCPC